MLSRTLSDGRVLNPADYAVRLHTTLNRLRPHRACTDRYEHLLRALGGPSVEHDAPINLLTILEHNGVDDCLWALYATTEDCDQIARLIVADFAELVLSVFEGQYPNDHRCRAAIEAARLFALGEIDVAALVTARAAVLEATGDAWDIAGEAWEAAWTAAWDAVWTAARSARCAAGDAASALATQEQIIREYLLPDSEAA